MQFISVVIQNCKYVGNIYQKFEILYKIFQSGAPSVKCLTVVLEYIC